jgi:hypothetical protein
MPNPATVSNTITDDTNYTLSNSTPTRSGYTFAGWCDGTVTTTNYSDSCSGTTYQPGGTYTIINVGGSSTINLNAIWESTAPITYTVSSPSYTIGGCGDSFVGDGEYEEGETVNVVCIYPRNPEPCPYAEVRGLYMDSISVTNLATCSTKYQTCSYSFTMPAHNVVFSSCGQIMYE